MKRKNPFLVMVAILIGCATFFTTNQAQASIGVQLYEPIASNVTWDSASMTAEASGYQGSTYTLWLVYKPQSDTVVHTTTPTNYNFDWPVVSLSGLPSGTPVWVYAVVSDGIDTAVSDTVSFATNPYPHKAYIGTPQVLTSPSQTLVTFPYSVSVPTIFYVRYNNYQDTSTTPYIVNTAGNGTGVVVLSNPNSPGATYSGNWIRGKALSAGIVSDSTRALPSFTIPNWSNPDVGNQLTFSQVTQDSFKFTATITLGNSSTGVVVVHDLDSVGTVTATRPLMIVSHDTVITWTRIAPPYTNCGQRVGVMTNGGNDSATGYQRTLQVPAPDVIGIDTVNAGSSTTDIVSRVKTMGSWSPQSAAEVWCRWTDKNGVVTTTVPQTVSAGPSDAYVTFTGLNNLKTNPQQNSVMVYMRNGAGRMDSMSFTFKLRPLAPAVPIDNGWYPDAGNAYEIRIWHVNAGPSTTPYQVVALINVVGSGVVDTPTLRANQTGYTDFLKRDTIGNRTGNTTYSVRLTTKNSDGVYATPTAAQQVTTMPAASPTWFISNLVTVTNSSVNFKFSGNCNGTPSYAVAQMLDPWTFQVLDQIDYGYLGTGQFNRMETISDLSACTDYIVKVILHDGQMNGQTTDQKTFTTDCVNSVEDQQLVKPKLYPTQVTETITITGSDPIGECSVYDLLGSKVFSFDFGTATQASFSCVDLAPGTYVFKSGMLVSRFYKQ